MVTHHPGDLPVCCQTSCLQSALVQSATGMHVMGSVSPANKSEGVSLQVDGITVAMPMSPPHRPSLRFSDLKENQMSSPDLPPPPPPPLLLPPPPPPPPPPPLPALIPGLGNPVVGLRKKKRVRSFFWKTIPAEQVKGRPNLWTQGQVQEKYQIDVQTIEELFGQTDTHSNDAAIPARGVKTRSSCRDAKEEVSLLDSKRGMNIGIFLKQFKRPNQTIVDDIRHGNSQTFGAEPLRELLRLLPETEEVEKVKAFRGNVSKLPLADSFMYLLIQLPSYSVRIESMLLKEDFPGSCEAMTRDIAVLRSAVQELMCCEELHAVLHLVLQAGNILNAGGYAGNAVGFKLSSLLSLADTKANKPGMNLLHFVALEAQKKDERLLEFPLKLSHVQAAARISLETLDAELNRLTSRTRSVEENVQRDTELLQQLDGFLQNATSSLCSLRGRRLQLKKEGSELIDFFCEDRGLFRLDDCFSIFHTFCSRFADAVKENKDREAKEAARRRRIQELDEQKRHSWAGGEEVGGAFGLWGSTETDMSAAISRHDKAGDLLTPMSRPRSPLTCTLGHSGVLRRSRNSPSSSPSIAAERELSTLLEMATDRKVNLQRGRGEARTAFPSALPSHPLIRDSLTAPEAPSALTKTLNHTTDAYLSYDATLPRHELTVKPTSDPNQQSDHNNNGTNQPGAGFSSQATPGMKNRRTECGAATSGNMSVVLEKCTLVPELKAFDGSTTSTSDSRHQNDMVLADVEEEGADKALNLQSNSKQTAEKSHLQITEISEEDEGREDTVVVWCVTGVCEAAEDTHNTFAQSEADQCRVDNVGGNQQDSSVPATHMPSEPKPANEKSVPVPISSQPVPVSRCDESSLPASSPRWRPAEPASASSSPALTTDASEEDKEATNQGKEAESSSNEKSGVVALPERPTDTRSPSEAASGRSANKNAEPSSKPSTKNLPTSKTRPTGTKLTTSDRSKPTRTLTNTENQGMRRVVPISKTSRNTEKPTAHVRGSTSTAVPNSLPASNLNSTNLRRGERPATAPSSRRSSIHKTSDPKELKDQKVSGTQNQDLQRRSSFQKLLKKPKAQVEEKICRSTLRALSQGGEGGGSVSAPATPLHNTSTSSALLPGFARSTASSSFRRTNTTLAPSVPATDSSPKSSPKTASSLIHPPSFTRAGSLRVSSSSSSRSSDAFNVSSALRRLHSIRMTPRSLLPDSLTPPKGNQRNDNSSSDKSTHSDSGKAPRPSWR